MQCKVLIVDDEPLARVRLRSLLASYESEIVIVGEAGSGSQTIEKIKELDPDVVFLDVQMPDMDAFEVLKNIGEEDMPLIVFTTAYENFALRAFEENTVDYLLKPIDPERLETAIEKLRKRFPDVGQNQTVLSDISWEQFRELLKANTSYLQRIQVKVGDRILLLNVNDIVRFHSEEKYTIVYTMTGQYVVDSPLIELEKKLDPRQFVRIHRAHLVGVDYIAEIRKTDMNRVSVVLRDNLHTQLLVSRNFVKNIRCL